jgi:hypothetical protein
VAYSPDGKTVLTSSEDRTIILWNAATGERIRTFVGHNGSVYALAYNPHGATFASGADDGIVLLWDLESGAVLRLTTHEDAVKQTSLLLAELGLKAGQVRELQSVPMERLLAADAAVQKQITLREPGMTANTPVIDGKAIPGHPWDPKGPALSSTIPLLIGYAHTEETLYDRPTPEKLAWTTRTAGARRNGSGGSHAASRRSAKPTRRHRPDLRILDCDRSPARDLFASSRSTISTARRLCLSLHRERPRAAVICGRRTR